MHIRNATLADTADMANVAADAMRDDEFVFWLCPYSRQYPDGYRASILHRAKKRVWAGCTLLLMVTDQDDPEWNGVEKVISYLSMTRSTGPLHPPSLWDTINLKLNSYEARASYYLRSDRSVNYDNMSLFMAQGPVEFFAPYKENWEIDHFSVDVDFQRKGIGQKMIKAAQELASQDGFPIVLLASVKGTGLYTKCGFQKLGDKTLAEFKAPAMVWIP